MSIRRIGVLLSKEFLYGSRNYIFVFAIVAPIIISVVISLIFGTWLSETPKLGIVDEGDSRIVGLAHESKSVEVIEYGHAAEMKDAVEDGSVDAGIVLPAGFDDAVRRSERAGITVYIWGESMAKNRTIIGATVANLIRDLVGQEAPVEIESITLGNEVSIPWSDRVLPLIVLMTVFIGGLLLPASSLVNEKEKKTLQAVAITPTSVFDIFLSKGLLGVILSLFMGVLILIMNQAFGSEPLLLVLVLALGAIFAAELGILVASFIKDFTTLFTIWKSAGIILFAPVFIYLFPEIPRWIGMIFPTYYIVQPIVEISQLGGGWPEIAVNTSVLIAIDIVMIALLVLRLTKTQQYVVLGGQ
jgi:ABC-2 type transport system permease protein